MLLAAIQGFTIAGCGGVVILLVLVWMFGPHEAIPITVLANLFNVQTTDDIFVRFLGSSILALAAYRYTRWGKHLRAQM